MSKANEPAFPQSWLEEGELGRQSLAVIDGLTKREYFAGLVMQGVMSDNKLWEATTLTSEEVGMATSDLFAAAAVQAADALLKALEDS